MRIRRTFHAVYAVLMAVALILPGEVFGQMGGATSDTLPVDLIPGLGNLHHQVTTDNPLAQQLFDQGLTLVYAFNHDDAIRHFKKAAALDSNLAMAYWGISLALGPNYNFDVALRVEDL
ncbi:MAG: hypothetical protein HY304_07395 [candidate division Zixibacteria bacterium]|nr:hypothetical protein [candidate division Zixibacteria bacterium]